MLLVVVRDGVAPLAPVVVVVAVGEEVQHPALVAGEETQGGGARPQGGPRHPLPHSLVSPLQRRSQPRVGQGLFAGGGHAEGVDQEALLQGPVVAHGAVVVVGGPHGDDHRPQVGRVEGGQGALVAPGVGAPHRPHLPVAPLLPGQPLHGVEAVRRLVREGVPLPLAGEPPADVLHGAGVAPAGEVAPVTGHPRGVLVVRGALQERGEAPGGPLPSARREVEVGRQAYPVPRRHHHVPQAQDVVPDGRSLVAHRAGTIAARRGPPWGYHCPHAA